MAIIARPRSVRFIQVLRITVVLFISVAGIFYLRGNYGRDAIWVVDIPMAGMSVLYLLTAFWLLRSLDEGVPLEENPLYVQVFLDVLLMGMVVFYTGASRSPIQLIFLLPIVLASAFLYLRGSLFAASLSVLTLAAIFYIDARGWLTDYVSYGISYLDVVDAEQASLLMGNFLIGAFSLFAAAFVSGYMAENQLRIISELGEVTRRLERTRLDTGDVLENIESGLVTVDADGRIIFFNRAAREILGASGPEPQGRPYHSVFAGRLDPLAGVISAALEGEPVHRRNEVRVGLEEGRTLPLGVSPSILRGAQGIRGVVLIFQDLTEAKEMEEKIRRQDRLAVIGELSAGIAHELRNPLASISGSVEVLNESLHVEGEDQRLMKLVLNESSRINDIVEEFLNYARIQRVDRQSASLEALMQDVITLVRNHPSFGNGREVRCDLAGCPPVLGDNGQIKQVFLNLLLNALEAMEDSGEVVVRLPAEGESRPMGPGLVEVWVQDDGPGIGRGEAERVFEPFYTTKRGGTGLGLAVAQRIVESHDGRVLYAPPPDGRSTFRVYLPQGADAE